MFRKRAETLTPLLMVVGLGNPGPEYARTRHNVGWDVVDGLAEKYRIKLDRSEQRARYGVGKIEDTPVVLVKPLTFMNVSGEAVKPLLAKFGLTPQEGLIVIADDLDLPLGKLRMREGGSHGGHNGHRSLIARLGTDAYPRLKIGIGSVDKGGPWITSSASSPPTSAPTSIAPSPAPPRPFAFSSPPASPPPSPTPTADQASVKPLKYGRLASARP